MNKRLYVTSCLFLSRRPFGYHCGRALLWSCEYGNGRFPGLLLNVNNDMPRGSAKRYLRRHGSRTSRTADANALGKCRRHFVTAANNHAANPVQFFHHFALDMAEWHCHYLVLRPPRIYWQTRTLSLHSPWFLFFEACVLTGPPVIGA